MITKIFENQLVKTKITSANVQKKEMLLGYFIGPFIALISNAIFGSYLNRYYTDVLGTTTWAPAFAMLMPILSVICVVIGNLVVGQLMERTRTSQGKARPFMLLSAPLVVIAIILLFMAPNDGSVRTLIWVAVSYNLYYAVAYPLFYTSHSSMVSLSTRNSKHRGMLATFSNAAGVAAVGIGASIIFPLFQGMLFVTKEGAVDADASYTAWKTFILILCVVTFIGIVLEYFFTRERITEENRKLNIKEEQIPMMQQLKAVVSDRYWWLIILYFFLFQFGGLVKNGSMTYYCRWMFDAVDEATAGGYQATLGLIGGLPTAIGMVLAWPIADKLGKQKAVVAGMVVSVFGGLVSFLNVHSVLLVCAGVILKGIGSIPAMYVTLALLSDVLDHLEAKNGFRSDGFTMSVYGAIMVGLTGLGSGIINAFLGVGGYNASLAVQSETTQRALVICYLGIELVCYAMIAIMLLFLNVEKHIAENHQKILENQKASVLAAGGVWIEPAERLHMEQMEADRLAEDTRKADLRVKCARKGRSFEVEEANYQAKVAAQKSKKADEIKTRKNKNRTK